MKMFKKLFAAICTVGLLFTAAPAFTQENKTVQDLTIEVGQCVGGVVHEFVHDQSLGKMELLQAVFYFCGEPLQQLFEMRGVDMNDNKAVLTTVIIFMADAFYDEIKYMDKESGRTDA